MSVSAANPHTQAGFSPLISVIVPVYYEIYLRQCLDCIVNQTYSQCNEKRDKQKLMKNYLNRKVNFENLVQFLKEKFGDDLSLIQQYLDMKRRGIEIVNPDKVRTSLRNL